MLRIFSSLFCFHMILMFHDALHEAKPLIGHDVKIANFGEFPFVVSLSWNNPENLDVAEINHFCGGTLITHQHVITAAHCVRYKELSKVVVRYGSIDLRHAESLKIAWWLTYSDWSNVNVPRGYNADSIFDIAVIKLMKAVDSMIELPIFSYMNITILYGQEVKTAGWGQLTCGRVPRHLRVGQFFIMHPNDCEVFKMEQDPFLRYVEPEINLCSKSLLSASTSCGDSGSPLLSNDNHLLAINKNVCIPRNDSNLSAARNLHSFVYFYSDFIKALTSKI